MDCNEALEEDDGTAAKRRVLEAVDTHDDLKNSLNVPEAVKGCLAIRANPQVELSVPSVGGTRPEVAQSQRGSSTVSSADKESSHLSLRASSGEIDPSHRIGLQADAKSIIKKFSGQQHKKKLPLMRERRRWLLSWARITRK